ncbi:MAG TPA: ATP-binding protein [Bacteroidia bacterium]|nr:ATP-binding protein [Bacteroidia bacterium]HNT79720.1 ATP-binding protein [Bacteroidia bacterium]
MIQLFKNDYIKKIPQDDILEQNRYKLFRIFTLAGVLVALAVAMQIYSLIGADIIVFSLLAITLIFAANYAMVQKNGKLKLGYGITIAATFLIIHFLTYSSGGIRSSGTFYLGSCILLAFMLLGDKAGKVFFTLGAIHLGFFFWATENNASYVSNILVGSDSSLIDLDFLITGILASFLIAAQSNYLLGSNNIVVERITQSRDELAKKNIELAKLSLVASKTSNGVIITDKTGLVEWINDGFTRLYDYTLNEVQGKNVLEISFGEKTNSEQISDFSGKMTSSEHINMDLLKYKKNGETTWINVSGTPIRNEQGEFEKYIFIESDINERKAAEQKIAEYLMSLEKTIKELDKFAYVVSHDLKAPLRAIGNLSGYIEEEAGALFTEDVRENFNIIKGRVSRMEDLINGLLEYSKAHRRKEQEVEVDTNQLINEIIEFIGVPKNCTISISNTLPTIVSEKFKLQQVLSNIMDNAIKYNDKEQIEVKISSIDKGDFVEFTIEDNGPGIDARYHEKIFVIFQTLNARDEFESTGVGLAIVKKITEEAGGRVWVESEKGQGSQFKVIWPKVPINESIVSQLANAN